MHTHTRPFNSPFSRTTQVSRYQKSKTNLDFTEARDSEWQWHHLGYMQVCISLQTNNHASTHPTTQFFTGRILFLLPNQQHQSTEGSSAQWWYLSIDFLLSSLSKIPYPFSALSLQCFIPSVLWRCLLGGRKSIRPVKNWVVGWWNGYLSGARCRLAYCPADTTATHCLLLQ